MFMRYRWILEGIWGRWGRLLGNLICMGIFCWFIIRFC